ncbi:MAG: hypothetical protein P9L97_06450 [Candidatus Tenebribacter davisii]|nr:hypothetical protein [Candidatus Tenebribacter davisii]
MKLKEFLKLLKTPLLIIGIVIIILSILSHFFSFHFILLKDSGFPAKLVHFILGQFDYTYTVNFASWFISVLYLITSAGFFLIGFAKNEKIILNLLERCLLKLFGIVFIIISSNMIKLDNLGNSWLLVYLITTLVGVVSFAFIFKGLIKNIKNVKKRGLASNSFRIVMLLISVYFIFIIIENYQFISESSLGSLVYIIQLIQLSTIFLIYDLQLKISDNYNL